MKRGNPHHPITDAQMQEVLRLLRTEANQAAVARATGLSRATVNKIKMGHYKAKVVAQPVEGIFCTRAYLNSTCTI